MSVSLAKAGIEHLICAMLFAVLWQRSPRLTGTNKTESVDEPAALAALGRAARYLGHRDILWMLRLGTGRAAWATGKTRRFPVHVIKGVHLPV